MLYAPIGAASGDMNPGKKETYRFLSEKTQDNAQPIGRTFYILSKRYSSRYLSYGNTTSPLFSELRGRSVIGTERHEQVSTGITILKKHVLSDDSPMYPKFWVVHLCALTCTCIQIVTRSLKLLELCLVWYMLYFEL